MSSLRKMLSLFMAFALTFVALVPLSAPAFAQSTTGSIRGTVADPAGGAIVGASVRARNQATNVESSARTTGEGVYDIPGLIPGAYTVTVESAGFKRAQFTDVNVNLGQVTTIDAAMQAGGVEETVTVVAATEEVVQRDQAQISATFETRKVEELPSNAAGSGLDTLALLAPGVIPSNGFGGTNTNGTGLSVNGNRPRSNNFQIDGSDNNDLGIGGPSYFVGNQDQVAEFQIITNNFSAQYGRNQGAIVNIVTKSGTNDFHGTGFIYHRDQRALDTLTNIERASGQDEAPRFLSNVFGGTFGGPLVKDRAFFFGSYQGVRQRQEFIFRSSATNTIAILPEELSRLSSLYPGNPAIQAVANLSAFALTGNSTVRRSTQPGFDEIDQICLPAASGGGTNCFNAAFVERVVPSPFDQNEFSIRGDVKLTDRDSFYVRYLDQRGNNKNLAAFFLLEPTGGFNGDLPAFTKNLGGTYTRQIGSAAVNEFKATWQKFGFGFGGGCDVADFSCIPDPSEIANSFSEIIFPAGSITGENSGATLQQISGGAGIGFPQGRNSEVYQFADTVTLTRGRHTIITGAEVKYLKNSAPFLPTYQGSFRYAATPDGLTAADRLVSNSAQRLTLAVGQPIIDYTEWDQYYFFQDDWKVRDNLTLNLGLRYEYTGQPINDLNDLTVARESGSDPLFNPALPLEVRTVPRIPPDKNNFAPRFGFAWSPRWNSGFLGDLVGEEATVVRGGFSIAYDPAFYNILLNVSNTAPTAALLVANNLPASGAGSFGFINDATAANVQAAAAAAGVLPIGQLDPRFLSQTIVSPDFHAPYAMQFSLGVQRQLNRNNVFELRYVGTRGRDLFQSVVLNPRIDRLISGFTTGGVTYPGFPNLVPSGLSPLTCTDVAGTPDNEGACQGRIQSAGRILSRQNSGSSQYDALQARYNGRLFDALSLGLAYTFSKTIDNASEIFAYGENSPLPQNPFDIDGGERSISALHRPHAFALNFLYDVPAFKEQRGFVGRLLGGWQLNGTHVSTSGRPFTPSQVWNASFVGGFGGNTYLTDQAESLRPFYGNPNADPRSVGINQLDAARFFGSAVTDPNGFLSFSELNNGNVVPVTLNDVRYIINAPGSARFFGTPFGNVPRNAERGPRVNQFNLGVFKNTKVRENVTVQFRTEIYNLFNHPNPGYGVAAATNPIPAFYVDNAAGTFNARDEMEFGRRVIQFGLRIIF